MFELEPTAKVVIYREGTARLYRFGGGPSWESGPPVLLVPSVINRWYVLDLMRGSSLVEALVFSGLDVFCLDWGVPEDEDRYLGWDQLIGRLSRAIRVVERERNRAIALLGYCMGGTVAGICAALAPELIAALVNLAGPFDFSVGGRLVHLTDRRWFDPKVIAEAGNISGAQMQAGFLAMRPTGVAAKWTGFAFKKTSEREAFLAVEAWASDNVPFPADAYATYVSELYQDNALIAGRHFVRGRRVELGHITCPVLVIASEQDTICPLPSARALLDCVNSPDRELYLTKGGHVGSVVGSSAAKGLYPKLASWLTEKALALPC